ncbi:MAG: universal stress protein [Candidatus Hydrogenedentes bacterium]|nr:universal stress protein [Candidatus Hydrogenedentota bacterium]
MARKSSFLFPTDFSAYAEYAMHYAFSAARRYGAEMHLVHVLDPDLLSHGPSLGLWVTDTDREKVLNSLREHVQSRLDHLIQVAEEAGVRAVSHIAVGNPSVEICRSAQTLNCNIVLIGTHGRSGFDRYVYGSTCEKVVRMSSVPVLSIKNPIQKFVKEDLSSICVKRVLFPTDFSSFSQKALPLAASFCQEFGATLVLAHVWERAAYFPNFMPEMELRNSPKIMNEARESLEKIASEAGVSDLEIQVLRGIPHREIVQLATDTDVDLVVMATHGRSGMALTIFGSVAEKVVRSAPCPVLTVRPTARLDAPQPTEPSARKKKAELALAAKLTHTGHGA